MNAAINTIRAARELVGIQGDRELMERCGIPYSTYSHERKNDPGTFRLYELRQIFKETRMPDEMILKVVKG